MNFASLTPEIELCAGLLEGAPQEAGFSMFALCAKALRILSNHADEYDQDVKESRMLFKHFKRGLQELAALSANSKFNSDKSLRQAKEKTFALIEELAVFMREKNLRASSQSGKCVCRELLDYFESSGHRRPDDGTIVAQFYFVILPLAITNKLINQMSCATQPNGASPNF